MAHRNRVRASVLRSGILEQVLTHPLIYPPRPPARPPIRSTHLVVDLKVGARNQEHFVGVRLPLAAHPARARPTPNVIVSKILGRLGDRRKQLRLDRVSKVVPKF